MQRVDDELNCGGVSLHRAFTLDIIVSYVYRHVLDERAGLTFDVRNCALLCKFGLKNSAAGL